MLTVEELTILTKKQSEIINELSRRLGLDSNTSSKPPSTDGIGKKCRSITNGRGNTANATGDQTSHKDTTLEVANYRIMLITKVVTNHNVYKARCSCGCITKGSCAVANGVSYCDKFKSLIMYLSNYMFHPLG